MYLLIWITDGKILYQRFKNLDDMINKANEKEEVIAHTKILSPMDMINISEEREDKSLFEILAKKFKPKQEKWDKDNMGPNKTKDFKYSDK